MAAAFLPQLMSTLTPKSLRLPSSNSIPPPLQSQPKATHPALAARQNLKLITKKYLFYTF
ncbi:hypothetical protein EMIT0196MI5_170028 [Pseudomonas sp. IT-196MI5]